MMGVPDGSSAFFPLKNDHQSDEGIEVGQRSFRRSLLDVPASSCAGLGL